MPVDATFLALMIHTVTLSGPPTRDDFGKPTYPQAVQLKGRVENTREEVRTADGDVVEAKTKLFLPGAPAVTTESRITLPDGTSPPIVSVAQESDARGPFMTVVYF